MMSKVLLLLALLRCDDCLRLRGSLNGNDFFSFVAKFGFQKTQVADTKRSQGVIFGNVTLKSGSDMTSLPDQTMTLVVLDRSYFLGYYGNRSLFDKHRACQKMFHKISGVAYDSKCFDQGQQDFIRSVPCPPDGLCLEEDNPSNVISGHQLTYRIQDPLQPRFWYVSFVACFRNHTSCQWEPSRQPIPLDYDLWLVNGNPDDDNNNPFTYQYSCDDQGLFALYFALLLTYAVLLTPMQCYASQRCKHPVAKLLLTGLLCQSAQLAARVVHRARFATDGEGVPALQEAADVLEISSQSLFMLLLLLLAMGWAVTNQEFNNKAKVLIFSTWVWYTLTHCLLHWGKKTAADVIDDVPEYATLPGALLLLLRVAIIAAFLLALRSTLHKRHNGCQDAHVDFFLHFAAASLVWFSYLPLAAAVAWQISPLWRKKFFLCVVYSADAIAYAAMTNLLWPGRKDQYYMLAGKDDPGAELADLLGSPGSFQEEERVISSQKINEDSKTDSNVACVIVSEEEEDERNTKGFLAFSQGLIEVS